MITPITGAGAGSPAPPVIAPEHGVAPTTVPPIESAPLVIEPESEVEPVIATDDAVRPTDEAPEVAPGMVLKPPGDTTEAE